MKHHAGLDLAAGADVGQRRRLDRPVLVGRRRADRGRHVLPDPSEVGSVIGLHGDQYDHHNQTRDDCVQDRDRANSEFHSRRSPHVAPILILMLHRYRPELKVAGSSPRAIDRLILGILGKGSVELVVRSHLGIPHGAAV